MNISGHFRRNIVSDRSFHRLGLILLIVAICLVASGCWSSSGRLTKENAAKVKEGMTLPEVIAILGTPGGPESPSGTTAMSRSRSIRGPIGTWT
jgi:hypothetical protein